MRPEMPKARYVINDRTLRVRTVQRPVEVMERKCEHCGTWFEVDPRQAGRARYCPQSSGRFCRNQTHREAKRS